MKKVLELPAFRRLLVATVFNELAWWIGSVSLALLIYRRTGSALGATAFFLCSQLGPALLSPFLVVRLDQRSPKRILAELYALEGVIYALFAWLVSRLAVAPILALVVIDGALFTTARVLTRTSWTAAVSASGLLPDANAIFSGTLSACGLLGPPIGGALVAINGTRTALAANICMFGLVVVLIVTARGLPRGTSDRTSASPRLRASLRNVGRDRRIRTLFGLQAVALVFFSISLPVEVVLVRHTLHSGAGSYGLLLAVWGGGMVLGSVAYARRRGLSSNVLLALGAAAFGAGFLVMAVAPSIAVATAGAAVAGIGNGSQYVAFRTALQEMTPPSWMAAVLSLNESLFLAVPGIGIVVGGAVTALAGPRPALAIGAGGSLILAFFMWSRLRREDQPTPQVGLAEPKEPLTIGQPRA